MARLSSLLWPSSAGYFLLLVSSSCAAAAGARFEESGASRVPLSPDSSSHQQPNAQSLAARSESFEWLPVQSSAFVQSGSIFDQPNDGPPSSHSAYRTTFSVLLLATTVLGWFARPKASTTLLPESFKGFQRRFILVWILAVSADWLQGPYVYAVYVAYGYAPHDIALLFAIDFFSAMIFSTFVGTIVDSWGRKRGALLYCVLSGVSCLSKHSSAYGILLAGRVVGAAATSLLFSTFECWMVAEHRAQDFDQSLLQYMFGLMYFAQYLTAVMAGLLAQASVRAVPLSKVFGAQTLFYGGVTIPYDLAFVLLAVTFVLIVVLWGEHRGGVDVTTGSHLLPSLAEAGSAMRSSSRVLALGVLVAFFEGAMMCFIFNWTPAMTSSWEQAPRGLIFSAFMMACMCGSSVFTLASPAVQPARQLFAVVALGAAGLGVAALGIAAGSFGAVLGGFVVFEFCVGFYFPSAGSLKSLMVPERNRASIYCLFRVPLNAVAVGMVMTQLSLPAFFGLCSALVSVAAAALLPLAFGAASPEASHDQI